MNVDFVIIVLYELFFLIRYVFLEGSCDKGIFFEVGYLGVINLSFFFVDM